MLKTALFNMILNNKQYFLKPYVLLKNYRDRDQVIIFGLIGPRGAIRTPCALESSIYFRTTTMRLEPNKIRLSFPSRFSKKKRICYQL